MSALADLARPPAHRGPLIAAGSVLLAVGVGLVQLRLEDELGRGWHTAIPLVVAALVLWLAFQERPEGGAPPGHVSVLLVTGLALLYLGLLRFADLVSEFGGDFPAGSFVWTSLLVAGVALYGAGRRNSAVCALIAAVAVGIAVLSAVNWIFDATSATTYRWLLLLLAVAYAIVSLGLRGGNPRHSEQLVNAAGFAILSIALVAAFGALFGIFAFEPAPPQDPLPDGWELVLLVAGCGLVAYAAVDRTPGPAYLGVAILVAFVGLAGSSEGNLEWWPAIVLAFGVGVLVAGLRPRRPLPPEPAPYTKDDLPLAARSAEDDVTVRVVEE